MVTKPFYDLTDNQLNSIVNKNYTISTVKITEKRKNIYNKENCVEIETEIEWIERRYLNNDDIEVERFLLKINGNENQIILSRNIITKQDLEESAKNILELRDKINKKKQFNKRNKQLTKKQKNDKIQKLNDFIKDGLYATNSKKTKIYKLDTKGQTKIVLTSEMEEILKKYKKHIVYNYNSLGLIKKHVKLNNYSFTTLYEISRINSSFI
mgnify:CR=1 FL=1